MKTKPQYYFSLRGFWKRARQEYLYYVTRPWTLTDVGNFWDTVKDYDTVNETLYTYYRRFTNSYDLAIPFLPRNDYRMLDIQARSGKGSQFWHQQAKIASSVCVDFSEYLRSLAIDRLKETGLLFESTMITGFPLPFADASFDLVCSYETVEHVYEYDLFILELARVTQPNGVVIITCPNVAWEWVHWLTAIININHSEGPHRFIRRTRLLNAFRNSRLTIVRENSTVIIPFNRRWSVTLDTFLEKQLPEWLKRCLALRRTFILLKSVT